MIIKRLINVALRVLAIILIGFVSAVIGLILGAIVGGNLAGIYELVLGYPFVFNGREGYEATGQIGFILGALVGFVASGVRLFGWRNKK
ncbi:MAG TPA: hypothetical protein VLA49_16390 [Anaerolineales bacterium]|nr:hypothetical protein [Anaerolineales bacterium]